jgi:thiol-disulfide isomerase/thioredoxin
LEFPVRPIPILLLAFSLAACEDRDSDSSKGARAPDAWSGPRAAEKTGTGRLDRSHAGETAPTILFEDPAGEPASLADFRGKPVLVNLWATWCAPCVAEMPTLDALAAREPRIQVLALSQDLNGQAKVDAFFAARKFAMLEPYIDAELTLMTQLGISTLPTTILYDGQGRELWRMTGLEDWQGPRAAALIEEALRL